MSFTTNFGSFAVGQYAIFVGAGWGGFHLYLLHLVELKPIVLLGITSI